MGLGKKFFWPTGFDFVLQDPVQSGMATSATSGTKKCDIPLLITALKRAGYLVTDKLYVV